MAIGTWDDFTEKFGFEDGDSLEERDFVARKYLVQMLNVHPAMKGRRAFAFDRPGVHNSCLIIIVRCPKSKSTKQIAEEWENNLGKNPPDTTLECDLPDKVEEDINVMIAKAYQVATRHHKYA